MEARLTYLVEIVQRLAMDLGFVDTSGLGARCVCGLALILTKNTLSGV